MEIKKMATDMEIGKGYSGYSQTCPVPYRGVFEMHDEWFWMVNRKQTASRLFCSIFNMTEIEISTSWWYSDTSVHAIFNTVSFRHNQPEGLCCRRAMSAAIHSSSPRSPSSDVENSSSMVLVYHIVSCRKNTYFLQQPRSTEVGTANQVSNVY